MAPGASRLFYKPTGRAPLEINRLSCSLVRFTTVITLPTIRLYSHVNLQDRKEITL